MGRYPASARGVKPVLSLVAPLVAPLALAALTVVVACAAPGVRPAAYRMRPDSVRIGDLRGPFDGRVVDADSGLPIAGAQVQVSWTVVAGRVLPAPVAARELVTVSDATGRYSVSGLALPSHGVLADVRLLIFKRGYVAWRSDRRFDDFGARTDFTQTGHEVRLERWHSDVSHVRHLRYVGGGPLLVELTRWETCDAAAELAGRGACGEASPTVPRSARAVAFDAAALLGANDVRELTGQPGDFTVGELGGEPTSARYDSVHLRDSARSEQHDVAARIWLLGPGEAQAHYARLLGELPGVKETNELGDRSLRATSAAGDVLAVGFLDGRAGWVVLVQCGSARCATHEIALQLAARIRERLPALPDAPPVLP